MTLLDHGHRAMVARKAAARYLDNETDLEEVTPPQAAHQHGYRTSGDGGWLVLAAPQLNARFLQMGVGQTASCYVTTTADQWIGRNSPVSAEQAYSWAATLKGRSHVCVDRDGRVGSTPDDLTWLSLVSEAPVTRSVLVGLLRGVNELIRAQNFQLLDRVLTSLDTREATTEALLAIARLSSPARPKLPHWRMFVDKVRADLTGRGENVAKLMMGLPG